MFLICVFHPVKSSLTIDLCLPSMLFFLNDINNFSINTICLLINSTIRNKTKTLVSLITATLTLKPYLFLVLKPKTLDGPEMVVILEVRDEKHRKWIAATWRIFWEQLQKSMPNYQNFKTFYFQNLLLLLIQLVLQSLTSLMRRQLVVVTDNHSRLVTVTHRFAWLLMTS